MSHATTTSPPEGVIRSRRRRVAGPLAVVAVTAGIGVTLAAPAIFGSNEADVSSVGDQPVPTDTRYDGGPNEGTRGPSGSPPINRYDGGPEEGTRGPGL